MCSPQRQGPSVTNIWTEQGGSDREFYFYWDGLWVRKCGQIICPSFSVHPRPVDFLSSRPKTLRPIGCISNFRKAHCHLVYAAIHLFSLHSISFLSEDQLTSSALWSQ